MGDVDSAERLCVEAGNIWKLFSPEFCYEPKTTPKYSVLIKTNKQKVLPWV